MLTSTGAVYSGVITDQFVGIMLTMPYGLPVVYARILGYSFKNGSHFSSLAESLRFLSGCQCLIKMKLHISIDLHKFVALVLCEQVALIATNVVTIQSHIQGEPIQGCLPRVFDGSIT